MRTLQATFATAVALFLVSLSPPSAQAAIAFVGNSSATTPGGGAPSLNLKTPSGIAAGQVEIASLALTGTATITPPSGWTQIASTPVGTAMTLTSFWHIATSTESTTTWTFSATTTAAGGIVSYSGVDTTTLIDSVGAQTGSTSSTTATVPSTTATYTSDVILGVAAFNNQGSLTAASGTTSRFTAHVGASTGPTILSEDLTQAAAGSTAVQTITDNTSATAWVGEVIALKAASSTGTLAVSTTAAPSFSANLDTGDATPTYALPISVTASTLPAPGWNVTLTSTTYTTGTNSLSTGASTISSAPTIACLTSQASCTAATNSVSYPVNVPAGSTPPSAVKVYNAASGTGAGKFTLTPTIAVSVPQNSYAGMYSSNLTLAIVSGP